MKDVVVTLQPDSLNTDLISQAFLRQHHFMRADFNQNAREQGYGDEIYDVFEEFDVSKAVVWIDPLDGTYQFTVGNLSAVTVLIGLAIDGIPKIGVVHTVQETNEVSSPGMTIFGTQEHGAFRLDFDPKASD